jgi:hypothetical protein
MEIRGYFQLQDNRLMDFNEDKAAAIKLFPDAIGRICNSHCQGNLFENCFYAVAESRQGLWKNCLTKNNMTIECINKIPE